MTLWKCPTLSTVWQVYFADLVADTNGISDFLDIIQCVQQDKSRFALFAWTTSLIWMRRNKIRVGEETFPLTKISSLACEGFRSISNCVLFTQNSHAQRDQKEVQRTGWNPDEFYHEFGVFLLTLICFVSCL
nr:hypothetical protein CFP56_58850 [Quercus suber]